MIEGYILGHLVGGAIVPSGSHHGVNNGLVQEVWVNTGAIERVRNPLDIIATCTGWHDFVDGYKQQPGRSYGEIFMGALKNPEEDDDESEEPERSRDPKDYEVLRIIRILSDHSSNVAHWFEYISKTDLEPVKA